MIRWAKQTRAYGIYREFREILVWWRWEKAGRPEPPPHGIKMGIVKHWARRFGLRTFIETGTCYGDMVAGVADAFDDIYSIELSKDLHRASRIRLKNFSHVHLIHGDSAQQLPKLLRKLKSPSLFWLDAHYSGGKTTGSMQDSPIMKEVAAILDHNIANHVILIDDAREFGAKNGYPDMATLSSLVRSKRPDLAMIVERDVICIYPSVRSETITAADERTRC